MRRERKRSSCNSEHPLYPLTSRVAPLTSTRRATMTRLSNVSGHAKTLIHLFHGMLVVGHHEQVVFGLDECFTRSCQIFSVAVDQHYKRRGWKAQLHNCLPNRR